MVYTARDTLEKCGYNKSVHYLDSKAMHRKPRYWYYRGFMFLFVLEGEIRPSGSLPVHGSATEPFAAFAYQCQGARNSE